MNTPTIKEYEESPAYEKCPFYSAIVFACTSMDGFNTVCLGRAYDVMQQINLDVVEWWEGDSDSLTLYVNPIKPLFKKSNNRKICEPINWISTTIEKPTSGRVLAYTPDNSDQEMEYRIIPGALFKQVAGDATRFIYLPETKTSEIESL